MRESGLPAPGSTAEPAAGGRIPGRAAAGARLGRGRAASSAAVQIVATPGSGNGGALKEASRLREALRARGREARLDVFPDLPALRRWAAAESARFAVLVCVGGDGTQSTAAAAAVRRGVPFVPMPAGFGNLFARAFGHPRRADEVSELLEQGVPVAADVGLWNGELFLCHASFGLLSEIQERVEAGVYPRVRWRRWVAYYRAAVRHLRTATLAPMRVAVDGRTVVSDAVVVSVANVETYGGWLRLTPGASPLDGLFDVLVMPRATKGAILAQLLRRHLRLPGGSGMRVHRGRRVSVHGLGWRDELELVPGVLPVLVSRETARALGGGRISLAVPPAGRRRLA